MTTANDHIKSIQSRIDELEQTVSERGDKIKARTRQLKDELQEELSPGELIRKHPLEAAGVSFVTGLIAGRAVRSMFGHGHKKTPAIQIAPAEKPTTTINSTLSIIGIELLHAAKELAVTWLRSRIDEKKKKPSA
jgi:hypothetical protein